jgi:hypothetical protein
LRITTTSTSVFGAVAGCCGGHRAQVRNAGEEGPPVIELYTRGPKKGEPILGDDGKPAQATGPKYSGLHAARHFYASWYAAPKESGGLGLSLTEVRARMGHATLAMTAALYGHLSPRTNDAELLAAGERALQWHEGMSAVRNDPDGRHKDVRSVKTRCPLPKVRAILETAGCDSGRAATFLGTRTR